MGVFLATVFNVEVELVEFSGNGNIEPYVKEVGNNFRMVSKLVYSLEEQLEYLSEATVVIAPCGGLSYIDVFQTEGTVQITIEYWNSKLVSGFSIGLQVLFTSKTHYDHRIKQRAQTTGTFGLEFHTFKLFTINSQKTKLFPCHNSK